MPSSAIPGFGAPSSANMSGRQDVMSAHSRDALEFFDHNGLRNHANKPPPPDAITIVGGKHRSAGNTTEIVANRRQTEATHVDPVAPVETASDLVFGEIGHGTMPLWSPKEYSRGLISIRSQPGNPPK